MEEETEKKYQNIIQLCRQNHTSFVDYEFPPNDKSIGEEAFKRLFTKKKATKLNWLRPNQIVTSENDEDEWSVLNDPKPSDVSQSRIVADCAFIAAMIAIAEHPDVLDKIFPSKEYSPEGIYRVRLYIDGQWRTTIVDDYIPCFVDSSKMATGVAERKQLWVPLIEKALAKQFGNYSAFEAGNTASFAMTVLTGSCCISTYVPKHPDDFDLFWNIMKSSKSFDFLMCASSIRNDFREKKGVVFSHGYSILDLNDEHNNRLLLLRNPHGMNEWTGKWSKNWDGWPDSMKDELLIDEEKESGTFWIEFDDFMSKFESITVCKIRSNWHEFRYELTIGLDTPTVRVTVTETCEASFAAFSKRKACDKPFEETMISVHRISDENIVGEMIGRSDDERWNYMPTEEFLLTPGKYIMMLYNFKNMNKVPIGKILVCYSFKPIFHELISQTPLMFNQAIREIILKEGKRVANKKFGIFLRVWVKNIYGLIYMADNFLKTQYLHLSIDYSASENMKSTRGSLKTTDIIPPMSYQIVQIITPINFEKKWFGNGKTRHNVTREKFIEKEITHDRSIVPQTLQHYPIIDPLDSIHSTQSIFYDSGPIEVPRRKMCQKRIKHLLRRCECRT